MYCVKYRSPSEDQLRDKQETFKSNFPSCARAIVDTDSSPACVRVTFPSRAVCSPDMFLEARFLCKILPARVTPVRSYHLKVLGFRTKGYPVCVVYTGIPPSLCVCVCVCVL